MSHQQTHVIVGASLAGAKAAETLRSEGFDGRVLLLGAEPDRPYERPPLSKQFLRGETAVEDAFVHDEHFYRDNDIELRVDTRVDEVDVRARTVTTEGGESIRYDRLLLATGSRPRRLRVPGAGLGGVHYLRSLRDSEALRDALPAAERVVVVGAGWIGSEVAASIRQLGIEVAIIDPAPVPLAAVLGPEVGAVLRDLHTEHGVRLRFGETLHGFVGDTDVAGVRTLRRSRFCPPTSWSSGSVPNPASSSHATPASPSTAASRSTSSSRRTSRASSRPATWRRPGIPWLGRRVRVEHWANAKHQGVAAAKNMLGAGIAYERQPYFFSDQYDFGLEYSGHAPTWDRVVFRGDPATREFIAFYIADNRVVAGAECQRLGRRRATAIADRNTTDH